MNESGQKRNRQRRRKRAERYDEVGGIRRKPILDRANRIDQVRCTHADNTRDSSGLYSSSR